MYDDFDFRVPEAVPTWLSSRSNYFKEPSETDKIQNFFNRLRSIIETFEDEDGEQIEELVNELADTVEIMEKEYNDDCQERE